MFAATSVLACALAALQSWYRVQIGKGSISYAICYTKDFQKLMGSRSGHKAGDFTIHTFPAADPAELFRDFSVRPKLWPDRNLISEIPSCDPLVKGFPCLFFRSRPPETPVGGWKDVLDFRYTVNDELAVGGFFSESAIPPKRYTINCTFKLTLGMPSAGSPATTIADTVEEVRSKQPSPTMQPILSRLHYSGPLPHGLMVFSRPIDDALVQLVILDLRR
jgi:hypothetical protein